MFNILVVGGGLIGLLTARELVRSEAKVTVMERGTTGRESSWAGGGILSPLYPWRYPEPVTALAHWGQLRYEGICRELSDTTGIDPQWTRNGLLMVDVTEPECSRASAWASRYGYRLEPLDRAGLENCEPELGQGESGLWMPDVAQVRNPRLLQALRADLEKRGVAFEEQCEVQGFVSEAGRITGIRTAAGIRQTTRVVVAGGAWTGRLLESTGLSLPVEPVLGQMVLFNGPPDLLHRIVLAGERYLIPRRDGRVLVGSTLERTGFEKVTTKAALEELKTAAFGILPRLRNVPVETQWAGLRPGSPTGVPFIGEHPQIRGLYVNAGQFRNGVVMGLASARLLSDLMLRREPIIDPAPYLPGTTGASAHGGMDFV
ncbi:glycine oxidase ThiO [Thiohalomonas denitrificans]|uniref:Glycine oxidase n=1 Tax=Thiohalomonas denitrificans TaxID=415747 RepID=A0A1G5PQZ9_9GAMM|nr:glycine oxidase ThiO [Thiohalomonas denitrificans]SCZ51590.1 glycine oxidase [Thiohalomonas denitrificans]